jgi:hypothetical protein
MRVVRVLPRAHAGAVTALVAIGKEQESLISGTYVSIRQHTSAYVSAYLSIRQIGKEQESLISGTEFTCFTSRKVPMFTSDEASDEATSSAYVSIRQHTSAHVSIRQHVIMQQAHLRRNRCCFSAASPLLYCCFTSAALLLLYFRLC